MGRQRFELEELMALASFYAVTLSGDRRTLAYYADPTGQIELYVLDTAEGSAPRQVSHGEAPRSPRAGMVFTPAGDRVVFARDEGGDEQHDLYAIDLQTGVTERLTESPGQHIAGRVSPTRPEMLVQANRDDQMNLYVLDLESRAVRRLTHFERPAHPAGWSPDGEWVYFTANESANLMAAAIYRIRRDGTDQTCIYSSGDDSRDTVVRVSEDGRRLAIQSNRTGNEQPGILDLATGEARFFGGGKGEESAVDLSPDGRRLLSLEVRDGQIAALETDVETGERRRLGAPPGVVLSAAYLADGRVLLQHTDPTHRPALLALDLASGRVDRVLEAAYGRLAPDDFVPAKAVSYPVDDLTIHGILYKPEVEPGRRLPAVVWVHGGPTGMDLLQFSAWVQVMCNRGFAVLQVNYRGSTGYGKAFTERNRGDIGGGDARDVAEGVRLLAADPDIDPDRIVCAGISYGGYMTYRQLTHFPELWAGGMAIVGITDWEHMYGESMSHFQHYLHQLFGGPPTQLPERYRDASPIHEAGRLRAPLLILHGENDPRCPINQARRFRDRLVQLGRRDGDEFVYHEMSDAGHATADIGQKLDMFGRMETFLQRFAPDPSLRS